MAAAAAASAVKTAMVMLLLLHASGCNAKRIVVGGSNEWTYGVNYTDWVADTGPYKLGDSLVFTYQQNAELTHNVYLMKDRKHYVSCDFQGAALLANESSGSPGYEFVLRSKKPYYFACSAGNGYHCNNGLMKFSVKPVSG